MKRVANGTNSKMKEAFGVAWAVRRKCAGSAWKVHGKRVDNVWEVPGKCRGKLFWRWLGVRN